MSEVHVLVVCLGNVCRSPLAEGVLRLRLEEMLGAEAATSVRVSSAGVLARAGDPMDSAAAEQLRRLGGRPDGFVSRQLDSRMVDEAHLVLTATRELRSRLLEETPRALKRTFTLREFAALAAAPALAGQGVSGIDDLVRRAAKERSSARIEDYDVPDPIGRSVEVHRLVADLIEGDCSVVARAVVDATRSDLTAP